MLQGTHNKALFPSSSAYWEEELLLFCQSWGISPSLVTRTLLLMQP